MHKPVRLVAVPVLAATLLFGCSSGGGKDPIARKTTTTSVRAETDPAPGLNETFATMAEAHGWKVVDASRAVADTHGRWTKTLPCLTWETAAQGCTDGRIDVRSSDRTHFGPDDGNPYSSGRIRWATALSAQLP